MIIYGLLKAAIYSVISSVEHIIYMYKFNLPCLTATNEVIKTNARVVEVLILSVVVEKIEHRKYDSRKINEFVEQKSIS